jgi:hypothetical protein
LGTHDGAPSFPDGSVPPQNASETAVIRDATNARVFIRIIVAHFGGTRVACSPKRSIHNGLMRIALALVVIALLIERDAQAQHACSASGACTTVLATSVGRGKIVIDGPWIYFFGATGGVTRISNTGSSMQTMTPRPARSFALNNGSVYWSEPGRINVSSNGVTTVVAQPAATIMTDLVVTHSLVFWIADGVDVQVAALGHGTVTTLAHVRLARPSQAVAIRDLVTDGTYLYWVANDEIQRSQLSGSPSTISKGLFPSLFGDGTTIYVSDLGADMAILAPTGQMTPFVPTGVRPNSFAVIGSLACWASGSSRIECTTRGSRGLTSYPTPSPPTSIAMDVMNLYYVTRSGELVSSSR